MPSRAVTKGTKDAFAGSARKLIGLGVLCFVFLFLLWARAYQVQILLGEELSGKADRQYWASEQVEARRGEIFDRNGKLLAKSIRTRSVYVRPHMVRDVSETARKLARVLDISQARVRRLLRSKKKFVWVARKISDKQVSQLLELGLSGVQLKEEGLRLYPQGQLAGQLLGFVGVDGHGLEGIERSMDEHLSGQTETYRVSRDAAGQRYYDGASPTSRDGNDLYLTIDSRIQAVAEDALSRTVDKYNGKYGMCLVVEVQSGDILAWAQYPFFNPNAYRNSSPDVWKNRIALDIFEPGSTLKPLLVAAALNEGVCRPDKLYFCENGKWQVDRKRIRDTHEYQWLSVSRIIRYSSNIGSAKIGLELGREKFYSYLDRFGIIGEPSLPLPGMAPAMVRSAHEWTRVDLANASFGQGVGVTAVQLAQGFLTLARQGTASRLNLLRQERSEPPEVQVVRSETAQAVLGMLEDVVEQDGTGTQARITGIRVGGKTGTAQKAGKGGYGKTYVSSFVGFLPARDPRYLILCVVDEPHPQHYGGVVAAPAVQEIGTYMMATSGDIPAPATEVRDDTVSRVTVVQTGSKDSGRGAVPDVRGMSVRRAVEVLVRQGLQPELMSDGVVVARQDPSPATRVKNLKQSTCRLWLADSRVQ